MSEPTVEEQREDVWEILGKARVRAWFCPVRSHRTVEWRGDVAHCTHGTCELTSEDTRPWLRDMAEAIAKAETERDAARTEAANERSAASALSADLTRVHSMLAEALDAAESMGTWGPTTESLVIARIRKEAGL